MVIVAGKYGSEADDGISYTEKEYDYAVQLGKPVMGFLFKDLGELKGNLLEEDPVRREKLRVFREKVARSKLVKFYVSPEDLKAHVWQALATAFLQKPQTGWIRATNARRAEDLEEINRLQTRLLALQEEVADLKARLQDPRENLARGEEFVEWTVRPTAQDFHCH